MSNDWPLRLKTTDMTDNATAHPALAEALRKKGYETLTPVQTAVLDEKLVDRDLLVSAQTGSGKTVAFGLAMASTLLGDDLAFGPVESPLALIIAPTRELALQVKKELSWLYGAADAKVASCVGGMDMRDERRALARGAHIVVGTPGRLCDHIKRGSLDMSGIACLALDEADEMLKMGFREEIELILEGAPATRRTLLFSATVPKTIATLAKKFQNDALRVNTAAEAKQHLDIEYRALSVARGDSENAIVNVLKYYDAKNAIIFGDTRIAVNRLLQRLNNRGFSVVALSGELNQKQRSDALQALRDGRAKVCVATDVAARGLDLPDLELVIHASIPKNPEYLLHRSGRTGRAGRKGVSVLIVPSNAYKRTQKLLHGAKITAEWGAPPSANEVKSRENDRMMSRFTLDTPVNDEERAQVERIISEHEPGQVAAAFIRLYRQGQSAAEELGTVTQGGQDDGPRKRKGRQDFDGGIWFSLNLGRKQKAEPRWILPMLSKSGDLKKDEIGSIKITETRSYVEVHPKGLERFLDAIGPDGKIEKAITATRLDGMPDFSADKPVFKPRDDKPRSKKSWDKKSDDDKGWEKRAKRKGPKKENFKAKRDKAFDAANNASDEFRASKPKAEASTADGKPKKPHKKKLARAKLREEALLKGKHKSTKAKKAKGSGAKLTRKQRKG